MTPRPGLVLEVDRSTPPTLFWHGERFALERLPEGSRVVYAPEPLEPLADPVATIRHALLHPLGDREPLPALLHAGMRLTVCFDDVSLPLPPMQAPTSGSSSSNRCSTWRPRRVWTTWSSSRRSRSTAG